MRRPFALLVAALLLVSFRLHAFSIEEIKPTEVIDISSGPITGEKKDGLKIFRGIPYATPPVGDLRWKPPVKPAPWTSPRPCVQFPLVAPQPTFPIYGDLGPSSEDCLYLNVWTKNSNPGAKLPVMVWVHGGGFVIGSSTQTYYEGSPLAKDGVVLVTFNYRLGALGFLAHPALSAESPDKISGNYGLMDQILALQWVQENISKFGGDPANVTLWGESAGGAAVAALMSSPQTKGLYHRAIIMSGSHWVPLRNLNKSQPGLPSMEERGAEIVDRLNLPKDNLLKALRAVPAAELIKAAKSTSPMSGISTSDHLCIDGKVLTEQFTTFFGQGKQPPVPTILGTVTNEGSMFGPRLKLENVEQYKKFMTERYGAKADAALAAYPAADNAAVAGAIVDVCTDVYVYGTRSTARSQSKIQPLTFEYVFTRHASPMKRYYPTWGVYHGAEVPYFFGNLESEDFNDDDKDLSKQIRKYLVQFAKTGNPNGVGPKWPAYTAAEDKHLILDTEISTGQHQRKKTLDALDEIFK